MKKMLRLMTGLAFSTLVLLVSATTAAADVEPTSIAKDSVLVQAYTYNSYRGDNAVWSWTPDVSFKINGPVAEGNRIYVEYSVPGSPVVQFDCRGVVVDEGYQGDVKCTSSQMEAKATTYAGLVPFAIKLRNELLGTAEVTLFTGRMNVAKVHSGENGLGFARHFNYYVDYDWALPIAYVYYTPSSGGGWDSPNLTVAFWARGYHGGDFDPHLFYKGREVGVVYSGNTRIGKATCGNYEYAGGFVRSGNSGNVTWTRVDCTFTTIAGWDNRESGRNPDTFLLNSNTGVYGVRLLLNNRLSRELIFTVGPNGSLKNGIADANRMNGGRNIIPVRILDDSDGQWNREAWRTDAFYGNPLKGFTPAP